MQSSRKWLRFGISLTGKWLLAAISLSVLFGCSLPNQSSNIPKIQLDIRNPLPIERKDVCIVLQLAELQKIAPDFAMDAYVIADPAKSGEHLPSQAEDTDYDGMLDTLAILVDVQPEQSLQFVIHYEPENMRFTLGYDKRTRAGIFPELGGAMCESESAAYRLLPGPIVDVLGKHEAGFQISKWIDNQAQQIRLPSLLGADGVGCGTFRLWQQPQQVAGQTYQRVLVDGPIRSTTQFVGNDIRADLTMYAGHSWAEQRVHADNADVAVMLPGKSKLIRNETDGFVYTWGKQTTYEAEDELGLALLYPREQLVSIEEQVKDRQVPGSAHYLRLKPNADGYISYRTLAIWDHGHEGITDEQGFVKRLKVLAEAFQNPLEVKVSLPPEKTDQKKR